MSDQARNQPIAPTDEQKPSDSSPVAQSDAPVAETFVEKVEDVAEEVVHKVVEVVETVVHDAESVFEKKSPD